METCGQLTLQGNVEGCILAAMVALQDGTEPGPHIGGSYTAAAYWPGAGYRLLGEEVQLVGSLGFQWAQMRALQSAGQTVLEEVLLVVAERDLESI